MRLPLSRESGSVRVSALRLGALTRVDNGMGFAASP